MTRDVHQQAQEWLSLNGVDGLSDAQQSQLQAHLHHCDRCREFAEATRQVIRSLRSVPMAAGPSLVQITQARVRLRAQQLRQQRRRMWLAGMACTGVGASAAVTTPILWRLFAWLGHWAGVSAPVWQTGFTAFMIVPALLVSVLLLARGAQMPDVAHGGPR